MASYTHDNCPDFCFLALEKVAELEKTLGTPLDAGVIKQHLFKEFGLIKPQGSAIIRVMVHRGLLLMSKADKKYRVNRRAVKLAREHNKIFWNWLPTS